MMYNKAIFVIGAISSGILSWALVKSLLPFLRKRALDQPNARSSHLVPTPRGGGIAILAVVLPGWLLWAARAPISTGEFVIVGAAALLAAISWLDDQRSLNPAIRFVTQLLTVGAGLLTLTDSQVLFNGALPLWLDRGLTALTWLWFINLFNFMDGIDGIAGTETIAICLGIIAISCLTRLDATLLMQSALLLGGTAGFLLWNWPPARIFMGDVGSAPLGFLLGWLLLKLWLAGFWAAAAILPLYFIGDATITLVARGLRKERVWEAHRSHFYQKAVQAGATHLKITSQVAVTNGALICAVILAVYRPWTALIIGCCITAAFIMTLARR